VFTGKVRTTDLDSLCCHHRGATHTNRDCKAQQARGEGRRPTPRPTPLPPPPPYTVPHPARPPVLPPDEQLQTSCDTPMPDATSTGDGNELVVSPEPIVESPPAAPAPYNPFLLNAAYSAPAPMRFNPLVSANESLATLAARAEHKARENPAHRLIAEELQRRNLPRSLLMTISGTLLLCHPPRPPRARRSRTPRRRLAAQPPRRLWRKPLALYPFLTRRSTTWLPPFHPPSPHQSCT
jgi:hypothetical protein